MHEKPGFYGSLVGSRSAWAFFIHQTAIAKNAADMHEP
jgi:hypothetical protein